jgi:hypothetical protein
MGFLSATLFPGNLPTRQAALAAEDLALRNRLAVLHHIRNHFFSWTPACAKRLALSYTATTMP